MPDNISLVSEKCYTAFTRGQVITWFLHLFTDQPMDSRKICHSDYFLETFQRKLLVLLKNILQIPNRKRMTREELHYTQNNYIRITMAQLKTEFGSKSLVTGCKSKCLSANSSYSTFQQIRQHSRGILRFTGNDLLIPCKWRTKNYGQVKKVWGALQNVDQ